MGRDIAKSEVTSFWVFTHTLQLAVLRNKSIRVIRIFLSHVWLSRIFFFIAGRGGRERKVKILGHYRIRFNRRRNIVLTLFIRAYMYVHASEVGISFNRLLLHGHIMWYMYCSANNVYHNCYN